MPEPRSKLAILIVTIAVGPGVIGVITLIEKTRLIPYSAVEGVFAVVLGALWGLTGGILRRSLAKSIVGLNLGAFIGLIVSPHAPGYAREALLIISILLFLLI